MEKKRCNGCGKKKFVSSFYEAAPGKGKHHSKCKFCEGLRHARNYLKNRDRLKAIRRESIQNKRDLNRQMVFDHLSRNPCLDCGEPDPIVLQFDHVEAKSFMISQKMHVDSEKLKVEMSKCEVVCANCHTRRTAKRIGNWFKSRANRHDT